MNIGVLAQEKSFKASAPAVVKEGTQFNYVISGESQGNVSLNPPAGIRLLYGPSQMVSYQSRSINGKMENVVQITYTYTMMPEKTGEYIIPAALIKSGRKEFTSNEVRIKVVSNAEANTNTGEPDKSFLRINASKKDIYEGEQIIISTKIYVRERVSGANLPERTYEGFWTENLEADNFAKNEVYQGFQYQTQLVGKDLLTSQKKGEITIGPFEMDITVQKPVKSRSRTNSFFDDPFFDSPFQSYETVQKVIRSNALKINVKPLPSGAPESFGGAVGSFKVKAEITRDSLDVNESVAIKISISGKGNLGLISAPKIDFPPDLEVLEPSKTSSLKHTENGTTGTVVFEYVIIPRYGGNYRIAPVDFSFFNPVTGKYDRYLSKEFNFFARGESMSDDESGPVQSGYFGESVRDINSDISFIKVTAPKFIKKNEYIVSQKWYYITFATGLIILILLYFFWRNKLIREADVFYVRNKKAWKQVNKRLKYANKLLHLNDDGLYEEILKAVNGYLADRLAMNTSDMTRETIQNLLITKGVDQNVIDDLWELMDVCEMSRYSPLKDSDKKTVYEEAKICLSKIEEII